MGKAIERVSRRAGCNRSARTRAAGAFAFALLAACPAAAWAGVGPEPVWARQFAADPDKQYNESATAAASDGSGGVIIGGDVYYITYQVRDGFLAKYDGAGDQLWMLTFEAWSNTYVHGVASDGAGGAFVVGMTSGAFGGPHKGYTDGYLGRYDSGGNQVWVVKVATSLPDAVHAVTPDGAGGVFIAGYTVGDGFGGPAFGFYDAFVARYDGAGNQLWLVQFGTDKDDFAYAVAPDGSGGVFVAGNTKGSLGAPIKGNRDAFTARFSRDGDHLWTQQFGTAWDDTALGLAPAGIGEVIVVGNTGGSLFGVGAGNSDCYLARFGGAGNQIWAKQFGSGGLDHVAGVATDGADGAYLAGYTYGTLGAFKSGESDMFCARFDAAGEKVWISQFGTAAHEMAHAVAPNGSGGAFLTGHARSPLGGKIWEGQGDAYVAHFGEPPDAPESWCVQLGTKGYEQAFAVAPDVAGGCFVMGITNEALGGPKIGGVDAFLARHDATGAQVWITQFGTVMGEDWGALAPDGAGGVFAAGNTTGSLGGPKVGSWDPYLIRFASSGSVLWKTQFGTAAADWVFGAAADAGGVFLAGYTYGSLGGPSKGLSDAFLARFDTGGNQKWIVQIGTSSYDRAWATAVDGAGGAFMAGDTAGNLGGPSKGSRDAFLTRFDGSGNHLWAAQFGSKGEDLASAVAPDGAGGAYVAGWTSGDVGGDFKGGAWDSFLARYDSAGNQLWILQFGTPLDDFATSLASDGAGGAIVVGYTHGPMGGGYKGGYDGFMLRFGPGGDLISSYQIGTAFDDVPRSVAANGKGVHFVAGYTTGSYGGERAGFDDAFLARFDEPVPCPPSPTNLTASEPAKGVAALAWTDNADNETGFRVRRERYFNGLWVDPTIVALLPPDTASYMEAPPQNRVWRYQVQAFNSECDSDWTPPAPIVPRPPTGLTAANMGGSAKLTWTDNSQFEENSRIQRERRSAMGWIDQTDIATPPKNIATYTDSPGPGIWRYRIRAETVGGESEYTQWAMVLLN